MQAPDAMTRNAAVCTPGTKLPDVARLMVEHDCGEIRAVENSESMRPVGVVTDRHITCRAVAERKNPLEVSAHARMSMPCVTVSEEASVEDCCRTIEEHRIRRVPVVEAQGRCCGLVSQADIAESVDKPRVAEVVNEVSEPTRDPSRVVEMMLSGTRRPASEREARVGIALTRLSLPRGVVREWLGRVVVMGEGCDR